MHEGCSYNNSNVYKLINNYTTTSKFQV